MQYLGIEAALKNQPLLDPAFIPFGVWRREYEKEASRPFDLAVERDHGAVSVFETKLRGEDFAEANYRYIERFVKLLLWSAGGLRVWLCGDDALAKRLQAEYCPDGRRAFDVGFMQDVFEVPFEIVTCPNRTKSPSVSAATPTAAASALTPAAPTARSRP